MKNSIDSIVKILWILIESKKNRHWIEQMIITNDGGGP